MIITNKGHYTCETVRNNHPFPVTPIKKQIIVLHLQDFWWIISIFNIQKYIFLVMYYEQNTKQ